MRLVFIANAGFKYKAARYYSYERRIYNGLVRNGHDVWFYSDRDETRRNTPFALKPIGLKRTNQNLITLIRNFKPDALLFLNGDKITVRTLETIKTNFPWIRMGHIIIDAIFDPYNIKKWLSRHHFMDAHFLTTGGQAISRFSVNGNPCYFIPNITDRSMDTGKAFALSDLKYDIACPLNQSKDGIERENLALGLLQKFPSYRCHFPGFNNTPSQRGKEYLDSFSSSAISLNLSKDISKGKKAMPQELCLYSSDRLAHILGNGSLAFIDRKFQMESLLSEDEVVYFSNTEELHDKLTFHLKHDQERKRIAYNGWKKAHYAFNETAVTRYIMERLFDLELSTSYAWPTEAIRA